MPSTSTDTSPRLTAILARFDGIRGALLPVLHSVQDAEGHIPPDWVPGIAAALDLSRAEVHGVITFFHDFRLAPGGRRRLQLCLAEACQAVGARELRVAAEQRLGVGIGDTTKDGAWTLDAVYCLGNCACGPSVRIGDEIHARVDAGRLAELLADAESTP